MDLRRPIRNLHSERPIPPRFCDIVVVNGEVFLERKVERNKVDLIPWKDVEYQVKAVMEEISR